MSKKNKEIAVGIDLGTTNSVIATVRKGRPEVAENPEGNRATPSLVIITEDGPLIGETARSMAALHSDRVVREAKRSRGDQVEFYTDPETGEGYTPAQIEAMIVGHLRDYGEQYFGAPIRSAVITVPAYFKDAQRRATEKIGDMADLEVLRVINEPTAAVRAYLYRGEQLDGQVLGVFDLGGGTQDFTLVRILPEEIKTITTCGDRRLGGTDYTRSVYDLLLRELEKEGVELDPADPSDAADLQTVWQKAEKAKRQLSKVTTTTVSLQIQGEQISLELTRDRVEEMNQDRTDESRKNCEEALQEASISPEELDGLVLVGGATRMPCVREMLRDLTGGQVPLHSDISTDLAVARGAAIQAQEETGEGGITVPTREVTEACSFDIGVAGKRPGDPDPDNLFIHRIIAKGTDLPCQKSETFGLENVPRGNRTSARLIIAEGTDDQPYQEDRDLIQAFDMNDIPAGQDPEEDRIEITLSVDNGGIISCSARDLESGREVEKEINRSALQ